MKLQSLFFLVVLMFLASGIAVRSALAVDLDTYALAKANTVVNKTGPQLNWAEAQAMFTGRSAYCASISDVYVQNELDIAVGPIGGWSWGGIRAMVWGWNRWGMGISGDAYAKGWFESTAPFTINLEGITCAVGASGNSKVNAKLGIRVADAGGLILDVSVEYGFNRKTGIYFNVIGVWPGVWVVVWQDSLSLIAVLDSLEFPIYVPLGLGRATLYCDVNVRAVWPTSEKTGSSLQSDKVSGSFALPVYPSTEIEPSLLMAADANLIYPITATIYLGNFEGDHTAADLDPASLIINETLAPTSATLLESHPNFNDQVWDIEVDMPDFIVTYPLWWNTVERQYTVFGVFNDGTELTVQGEFLSIGHRSDDANRDGEIDIADVVYLINHIFKGGPAPDPLKSGDTDCDGQINIADIVNIINYAFKGGPPPECGYVD